MRTPLAILAILGSAASAQPPRPDACSPDAGPRYLSIFAQFDLETRRFISRFRGGLQDPGLHDPILEDDPTLTYDRAAAQLETFTPRITELTIAARLPVCRLGLPPDNDLLRSNLLSRFRDAARLLRAEAGRAWSRGDREVAYTHAATIIRLGLHLERQPVADSLVSMTAAAIIDVGLALADDAMTLAPESARPEAIRELRAALAALAAEDPAGLRRTWSSAWRARLAQARATLDEPHPERAATIHFRRLRNGMVLGGQLAERLEDLDLPLEGLPAPGLFEHARGWIIWSYWPAMNRALETGLVAALPRAFIDNRLANAESLAQRAEQAWAAGAPPDRIAAIVHEARRDSTGFAVSLVGGMPALRRDDLALRARIDELRARLDAAAR